MRFQGTFVDNFAWYMMKVKVSFIVIRTDIMTRIKADSELRIIDRNDEKWLD
jgi:hypothetical protein